MATLVPCPGCARHVRANEGACPFCASPIEAKPRVLEPMPADRLLARTAITFAAAAVTSLAACGKEPAEKPPAPVDTNNGMNTAPAYGVPPVMLEASVPEPAPTAPMATDASAPKPDAGATTNTNDHRAPVPAYGVPPINRTPSPKK